MGILFELGKELVKTLEDGALDTDQVWVQFICQTGPAGEHDPDNDPDDHVRPSHAAFHGQVFKMADAPIPPLDYGCRCAIRYVAKPASDAEKVLDVVAPTDDTTTATDATKGWLTNNVPGWPSLAKIALEAKPKEAIGLVQQAAKAAKITEPHQVAEMVVDVAKAEPKATAEVAAAPTPLPAAPPTVAPPEAPAAPATPAASVAETLRAPTGKAWAKLVTPEQRTSIHQWEEDLQTVEDVRNLQAGRDAIYDPDGAQQTLTDMEAAFAVAPRYTGTVYRGVRADFNLDLGDTVTFDAFASASKDKDVATAFLASRMNMEELAFEDYNGPRTLYKIELKGGGHDIAPVATLKEQREVIVKNGVTFTVVDARLDQVVTTATGRVLDNVTIVTLREGVTE